MGVSEVHFPLSIFLYDLKINFRYWNCACHDQIWHLRRQKFACPKVVLSFFQKFPKFFGIFNGENTLFTKSDKKWSSFRKKLLYFFHFHSGVTVVTLFLGRSALKSTDVNWTKKSMEDQVGFYENRQFKFFNPRGIDYSNISDQRKAPKYMD